MSLRSTLPFTLVFFFCILLQFSREVDGRGRGRNADRAFHSGGDHNATSSQRQGKFLSVFQIVKFTNDVCNAGGNRNGTCYTAEECESRGGVSSGSACAAGFGVCCVFNAGCGDTLSENCTYFSSNNNNNNIRLNPCTYTICRCSTNICRIRLDFITFDIAGPFEGTTTPLPPVPTTSGGSIGACLTDQFSVTSPGNRGSPIICGFNTGQHMYVDAAEQCNVASFRTGQGEANRNWEIKVTQYACGDLDNGGPDNCLQYFREPTGTVSSFNFPTTMTGALGPATTHLQNQCYQMCFRRQSGNCQLCFSPTNPISAGINNQASFGLTISIAFAPKSAIDPLCSTDYLQIPGGADATNTNLANRFCGRFFASKNFIGVSQTVCTTLRPFRMKFVTNSFEITGFGLPFANEQAKAPGGIIGFSLDFWQTANQGCNN